jgi:hypothetical protein
MENGDDTEATPSSDDDIGPVRVGAPSNRRNRSRPSRFATPPTQQPQAQPTLGLQCAQSLSSVSSFLPLSIWKVPFVPSMGRYSGLFDFNDIAADAYDAATYGVTVDALEVRGENVKALVSAFSRLLADTVKEGDFSHLLTPEHHFNMYVYLIDS